MSFLGDLVNSIGTNKAPALPKPPPRLPIPSSAAHSNPAPRPKVVPSTVTPPVAGLKRKLDERDSKITKPVERTVKPNPAPGLSSKVNQKPVPLAANGSKSTASKPASTSNVATSGSSAPAKPAVKGSYAAMLAKAKEAQQTRTQNPLGTIKHQATSKEKVSKLAERRRLEQEKLKSDKDKKPERSGKVEKLLQSSKVDRKRGGSPVKKPDQAKVPRAPRPPLHAPQSSSYKGTMGISAKRSRDERVPKKKRYDEYLATDEEDNSELDEDEDDGYGYDSHESSDMEAGLDDIDNEEEMALRAAKLDDAKELALETALKREKEERKRRLQAMAKKGR